MTVNPAIFKTYDIRGVWGTDLTPAIGESIGRAYVTYLKPKRVVCGRDVRVSGPEWQSAIINGIRSMGVDVVDIGVVTSDALYFAVGKHGFDGGAMVTASHNPAQWNGVKFTRDQAIPLYGDQGMKQIGQIVQDDAGVLPGVSIGSYSEYDIAAEYKTQVLSFANLNPQRRLKVVIDPGNGTAIRFIPDVMAKLPVDWQGINMEPDGTFPGRNPNPLGEGALDGLRDAVVKNGADLGVAFDADADRMFFTDEQGNRIFGDVLIALLAKDFLTREPGAAIVYNLICSHMVPEEIVKSGGKPIRSAVGHAHMKPAMRANDAVFGGEISGHFFFRDHYYADSGMIAMVVGLNYLSRQTEPLSALVKKIDIYAHTAEVNTKVDDIPGTIARIKSAYADGKQDEVDGLTVEYPDWWFNVRPSNTEPLLRLSVEAKTMPGMERYRDDIIKIIQG